MSEKNYKDITVTASDFERVPMDGREHDKKLESKPIGYFRDAFNRFCKNKSSVVAACIILFLLLYAIFVPVFCETTYSRALTDTNYLNYSKLPPKVEWLGVDGCSNVTVNESDYYKLLGIAEETGLNPIVEVVNGPYDDPSAGPKKKNPTQYYDLKVDNYYNLGMMYLTISETEYQKIQAWQTENNIQVIYPAITDAKQSDANVWYKANKKGAPTMSKTDGDGDGYLDFTDIYRTTTPGDTTYNSLRVAGDTDPENPYAYARVTGTSTAKGYVVRVSKYNYFQYRYGFEPSFVFGTNARGQDIFTRLAAGARFSFMLAIGISAINLVLGAIYGAIQGYYGGAIDLCMDRFRDILSGVPFMVVTTLFQLHMSKHVGPIVALLFAFVLTGWIGMAGRVRMQFYRFKGQEYILAARTLGARDSRLMFKHIFPNSLGTIITGSVLAIPGVIFSESSLTYLGIVNLESSTETSVGTMLANGKDYLATYPYIILFPALFISLLMISFNLFGNGLRDAFNPSLRGNE